MAHDLDHDLPQAEVPAEHLVSGDLDFDFDDRGQESTRIVRDQQPTMRSRMTIDLDDGSMDALFVDRKLSLEDTSSKPCIVPGNALHLIDDDPSPRSVTPSSVIIIPDAEERHDQNGERTLEPPPDSERPPLRVRFRSRVRITSGLNRHRHVSAPSSMGPNGTGQGTPGSSTSDSPSSSISAPLRYQADENAAWGPLGKRLSAYAQANGWHRRGGMPSKPTYERSGSVPVGRRGDNTEFLNERTSLLSSSRGALYGIAHDEGSREREASELEQSEREIRAAFRREEEAVFGKWPWRLFNHYVSSFRYNIRADTHANF